MTEAYKDKTFAHSGSTGDMDYVGGFPTKLKCVQQPTNSGTTTVSLRLATPGGLKKVELSIHYNGSGTESGKPKADIGLSEQNISVTPGGTHTVTVSGITGNVTVTTANSNVATATLEGNTLTITGVAAGQTGILLTQEETDNYKQSEAYCAVTVSAGAGEDSDDEGDEVDDDEGDDNGDDVNDGDYLDKSKQNAYVFTVESDGDGTYTIKYGEKELKTHATSLTLNWNDLDNGATNFVIHSLSSWKLNKTLPESVTGSDTLNANELEAIKNDGGSFQATCWNGKKFYLSVQ